MVKSLKNFSGPAVAYHEVGVINRYHYCTAKNPGDAIAADVETLKSWGVTYFQIDAEFSRYFHQ